MIVGDQLLWGHDDWPHLERYLRGEDPLAADDLDPLDQVGARGPATVPEWELFDRLEDPGERNNLAASQPERLASLRELLRERVQRSRRFSPEAAGEPDPESLEKLRGLGYVD